MQVSVILPTLNERENIEIIIPLIASVLEKENLEYEIIIVDDNSPDQTAIAARNLATKYPVSVYVRENEKGLASAAILGFSKAIGSVLVVMDSDLSHPVDKLPELIGPILNNTADITVGSRHIPGGGCTSWPVFRQIISRAAGSLAFGLTRLTDPTSGYMAVRSSTLSELELSPIGWKIVLEIVTRSQARVLEVPIIFRDRIHGHSKLTSVVQIQYLLHLFKLYDFKLPNFWQLVKFCLVGSSGLIIDSLALFSFVELVQIDPRQAVCGSFLIAVVWNFFLDRSWTFRYPRRKTFQQFTKFLLVCLAGLSTRILMLHLMLEHSEIHYLIANVLGVFIATAINFLGSRYLVFRVA